MLLTFSPILSAMSTTFLPSQAAPSMKRVSFVLTKKINSNHKRTTNKIKEDIIKINIKINKLIIPINITSNSSKTTIFLSEFRKLFCKVFNSGQCGIQHHWRHAVSLRWCYYPSNNYSMNKLFIIVYYNCINSIFSITLLIQSRSRLSSRFKWSIL